MLNISRQIWSTPGASDSQNVDQARAPPSPCLARWQTFNDQLCIILMILIIKMVCGNMTADSLMGWAEPQWQECISAWSTLVRSVRRTPSVTVTDCWIVPLNDRIVFSSVGGKLWNIIKQELSGCWLEVEQQTITNYKSSVFVDLSFPVFLPSVPPQYVSAGPEPVPSVEVSWRLWWATFQC